MYFTYFKNTNQKLIRQSLLDYGFKNIELSYKNIDIEV